MNKELLQKAINSLIIEDIYLHQSQSSISPDFDPKVANQQLSVQFRIGAKKIQQLEVQREGEKETNKIYRIFVDAGLRLVQADLTDEILKNPQEVEKFVKAEITAIFVTEYRLTQDALDKEAVEEFAKQNAGFHAWPYWREFAHSMCKRMLLPEIILPMYRITN